MLKRLRSRAQISGSTSRPFSNYVRAVEVKYYRTPRAQVSLLEAAASRLVAQALIAQVPEGMLVVSCDVPPLLRDNLEDQFALTLIDRTDLMSWATKAPGLVDELNALLEMEFDFYI